jgi:glycosyltransferase involved in cell wall biosynthesis
MRTVTHTDTSVVDDVAITPPPVNVCMFVLELPARIQARLMRDATALVKAGFKVTFVDVEDEHTRPVEEEIEDVHFKHIFMSTWYTNTRFKPWFLVKLVLMYIRSTVRLIRTPADIYHVHVEKAFLPTYIAARVRRKPLIFDLPDLPFSDPHLTRWRMLTTLSERLLARLIPYSSRIITSSPLFAQEIGKSYPDAEVRVILNVPAYRTVAKSDRLRRYLGLDPEVRIALFQGYIQPDRELDRLVLAAAFLEPKTVIVMMGNSYRGVSSQLEALIAREGLADRVKIIPQVPYEELLDWTASANIGLISSSPDYSLSVRYALPNKLFEYLMAGLPVLSMDVDAIADVLRTYDVGLVVSSLEPSAIGAGINTLLADREALARMRQNALKIARNEFNWEKESPRLIRLYQEILASPGEELGE